MAIINTWNMFGAKKPPKNVLIELLDTRTMTIKGEYFFVIDGELPVWQDKTGYKSRCENTDCWRVKNA